MSKTQMDHEPDLNELAAFAEGRLEGEARERVVRHLTECAACREIVALTSDSQPARSAAALRPSVWLSLAAMLAVVGVASLLVPQRQTSQPNLPAATPSTVPAPAAPRVDAPAPAPPTAAPASRGPAAPSDSDDPLQRRRSAGERIIGSKTFRLAGDEWIDAAYDPDALLREVEVSSRSDRAELLKRIPALEPYAALGRSVTVVHEGIVYRFE